MLKSMFSKTKMSLGHNCVCSGKTLRFHVLVGAVATLTSCLESVDLRG